MPSKFSKFTNALRKNLSNHKRIDFLYESLRLDSKSSKVNLGQLQAQLNTEKKVDRLADVEFQVFSQFGDDGIIQWLVHKLPIRNKTFIEFGVENYRESNTRFLLINNYWSGLVIDGSSENIQLIRSDPISFTHDLQSECFFITKDNINELISLSKFDKEVGLLSIDIDGNDYWVWQQINSINPAIVICEYNSLFGFEQSFSIEYKDDFVRGKKFPFYFYGASILSLCQLADEKGYAFIGCNSAGNNSYFIRKDLFANLSLSPITLQQGYIFCGFSEVWDDSGTVLRGRDKIMAMNNLPVINTKTGEKELINAQAIVNSLIAANKIPRK